MRTLLQRLCFSILLILTFSGPSFAQDTAKTEVKKTGADTKEARKAAERAAKRTSKVEKERRKALKKRQKQLKKAQRR